MYQQLKRASMALTLSSVCFLAFAQKTIQGTVKDANGDPMIGVTITDQNGIRQVASPTLTVSLPFRTQTLMRS